MLFSESATRLCAVRKSKVSVAATGLTYTRALIRTHLHLIRKKQTQVNYFVLSHSHFNSSLLVAAPMVAELISTGARDKKHVNQKIYIQINDSMKAIKIHFDKKFMT